MIELHSFLATADRKQRYLFIVPTQLKQNVIKTISSFDRLLNYRIIEPSEIIADASFSLQKTAFLRLSGNGIRSHDSAQEVIDRLLYPYFAGRENYDDFPLFDGLISNLIVHNELSLSDVDINKYNRFHFVIINPFPDMLLIKALEKLNCKYQIITTIARVPKKIILSKHSDYKIELEETIRFLALLINDGADIERIRIYCPKPSYLPYLKLLLKKADIPYKFNEVLYLKNLDFFMNLLIVLDKKPSFCIDDIQAYVRDYAKYKVPLVAYQAFQESIEIFGLFIIRASKEDGLSLLKYLFSITSFPSNNSLENSITLTTDNYASNYYYHLLAVGCTERDFLKRHSEDIFLSDVILAKHGFKTSNELNLNEKEKNRLLLLSAPNLRISFSSQSLEGGEQLAYFIKDFLNDKDYQQELTPLAIPKTSTFQYYYLIDTINTLDDYRLYQTDSNKLPFYRRQFPSFFDSYLSYQNQFKSISAKSIAKLLENKNIISATSLEDFLKCRFRFYLDHLLEINRPQENSAINIGNSLHLIIERFLRNHSGIDALINEETIKIFPEDTARSKYFRQHLRRIFKTAIYEVARQETLGTFKIESLEKVLSISLNSNFSLKFVGKIDKILKTQKDDEVYYYLVDYKSGNISGFNRKKAIYGQGLQLLCYSYLLQQCYHLKPEQIIGLYLQSLKPDALEQLESNKFPFIGLTSSEFLPLIDREYQNDSFIEGVKNGKLKSGYSITPEDISFYNKLIDDFLKELIVVLEHGSFLINPKSLEQKNISCQYCQNRDICCYQSENLEILDEIEETNAETVAEELV